MVIHNVFTKTDLQHDPSSVIQRMKNNLHTYEKILEEKENLDELLVIDLMEKVLLARKLIAIVKKFMDGTNSLNTTIRKCRNTFFMIDDLGGW